MRPLTRAGIAALALLCAFASSPNVRPAHAEPIDLVATRLDETDALKPDARIGELIYLAGFALGSPAKGFGGYSGLVADPSGRRLIAVSDLGEWLVLDLRLSSDSRLLGLEAAHRFPLLDEAGRPFRRKRDADAEAVDWDGDGLVVAFEQDHRLRRFAGFEPWRSPSQTFGAPPEIRRQPRNQGIETMARLPDGRWLLLSEGLEAGNGRLRAWLGRDREWATLSYVPKPGFAPVDAKALGSGDVLVVERSFSWLGGFAARVVRIDAATLKPGAELAGAELATLPTPALADNFEGLAVVPEDKETYLLYLIADDNQSPWQRTVLLQFRWRR
jgi:hypothetical protein